MAHARCGETITDTGIIIQASFDDIPKLASKVVVLYRSIKPPTNFQSSEFTTVLAKHNKNHTVLGFATSISVVNIVDGSANHFDSLPSHIKKTFKNTQDLKHYMGIEADACKLFAVVLEEYTPKGTWNYELTNVKPRSGYGKASIRWIPSKGASRADKHAFFEPKKSTGHAAREQASGGDQGHTSKEEASTDIPTKQNDQTEGAKADDGNGQPHERSDHQNESAPTVPANPTGSTDTSEPVDNSVDSAIQKSQETQELLQPSTPDPPNDDGATQPDITKSDPVQQTFGKVSMYLRYDFRP